MINESDKCRIAELQSDIRYMHYEATLARADKSNLALRVIESINDAREALAIAADARDDMCFERAAKASQVAERRLQQAIDALAKVVLL